MLAGDQRVVHIPMMTTPGGGNFGRGRGMLFYSNEMIPPGGVPPPLGLNGPSYEQLLANGIHGVSVKSHLRVDAPEFVPRFFGQSHPPDPPHPPQMMSPMGMVPQQQQAPPPPPPVELDNRWVCQMNDHGRFMFFNEIEVGIEQVMADPEHVDTWCEAIKDRIQKETSLDQQVLNAVIHFIVETALSQPHISYSMARLASYLAAHLSGQGPLLDKFRGTLLDRCKAEHDMRNRSFIQAPQRLRNFALFVAELFLQLLSGGGSRLNVLARSTLEITETLVTPLEHTGAVQENIKCIIRILKCCGLSLEESGYDAQVEARIQSLFRLRESLELSQNTLEAVKSLSVLRKNGWGVTPLEPNLNSPPVNAPPNLTGVFFGPDGKVLTAEESEFLEENLCRQDSSVATDEEEVDAFEEFLRSQTQ